MSRRARARAGAMLAKRFNVDCPREDEADDEADDLDLMDFDPERFDPEREQVAAMEPAR